MTQKEALDILKMGRNVFLTGEAGSGKTFVLNDYINYLKSHAVTVAVTASTGIAATHLGGQTIHSWSGLGVRDSLSDRDIDDMMQKAYLYKRFDQTKVLILDEVSMLHHFRLDMLEWLCRQFKHNEKPFGGMQVILCGDFFQLPPVTRRPSADIDGVLSSSFGDFGDSQSQFAFKATSWTDAGFSVCYLSEQHRQKDDEYLKILNEIRQNKVSAQTRRTLEESIGREIREGSLLSAEKAPFSGTGTTKLFTHNIDVDIINNKYLALISGTEKQYPMSSRGSRNLIENLKKSCLSPETLHLKVGAKVMFTKNDPAGNFVNGTLGVVESFGQFGEPLIRTISGKLITAIPASWQIEEDGKIKAEVTQLPLRLAWAITVHKSQGMSLDSMEVDLSKSFAHGMGYVALSRVRSLAGMKLLGFNEMSLRVDPEVLLMDKKFQELSDDALYDLKKMSSSEIAEVQKEFLKKVEPDEKKKVRMKEKVSKKSTEEITAEFLREQMTLSEIADKRKLNQETIVSHIEKLLESDKSPDITYLKRELKRSEFDDIVSAFAEAKSKTLSPVFNLLSKKKKGSSYLKIRLARLFLDD
jgi:ATP-dependent exoDNAse (exonuclease V) alpha subunit/DNA-binding CsgD family transcriptional regulator